MIRFCLGLALTLTYFAALADEPEVTADTNLPFSYEIWPLVFPNGFYVDANVTDVTAELRFIEFRCTAQNDQGRSWDVHARMENVAPATGRNSRAIRLSNVEPPLANVDQRSASSLDCHVSGFARMK